MAKGKKKDKDKGEQKRKLKSASGPLEPKIFTGLNEKRMTSGAGRFADRVQFKQGETATVQFLTPITEFMEIDQHQFKDNGRWQYVPCGGDGCPMCADDDEDVSKQNYRFFANVWDFKEKRVALLEGPKTLSRLLSERFKKNPKQFTERTWDVSKMATTPVSYDVDRGERDPVATKNLDLIDIRANVIEQFRYHFGDSVDIAALDADEGDDMEDALDDEVLTKAELKAMEKDELKKAAKNFGVKLKGKTPKEVINEILEAQG